MKKKTIKADIKLPFKIEFELPENGSECSEHPFTKDEPTLLIPLKGKRPRVDIWVKTETGESLQPMPATINHELSMLEIQTAGFEGTVLIY